MARRAVVRSGDVFDVVRFRQRSRVEREEAWLAERSRGVGGSDMGTILGLNRYQTPYALWLEKTGRRTHEDISGRWPVIRGNVMENELRRWFRGAHPEWSVTSGSDMSLVSVAHPCMHASLDGVIWDPESGSFGVLECKTAGVYRRHDWFADDGSPRIPDYYLPQVTHYMAVTGWSWGWFIADVGDSEPLAVRFERDEADVDAVVDAAETFWGFVERDEPPQLTGADVDELYPKDDGVEFYVPSDDEPDGFDALAAAYKRTGDEIRTLETKRDGIKDRLKALVDRHAAAQSDRWRVTYKTTHYKESYKEAHDARTLRVSKVKVKEK